MNMADHEINDSTNPSRLEELYAHPRDANVSRGYSKFVKSMRYILPFVAAALIVIVVTWPDMEGKIVAVEKNTIIPSSKNDIGQNELLNPRFETTDAQNQPVNVTATRALQSQENPNLVRLDQPNADLKMKDGSGLQIEALDGVYEQETEKLFLQKDVKIKHESGYELSAEEVRVDMKTREAFSDKDVSITGPDADITAKGLEGNMDNGVLTFKGPATLTLHNKEKPSLKETIKEDVIDE